MSQKGSKTGLKGQVGGKKRLDKSVEIFGVEVNGTQKSRVLRRIWLQRKKMLHVMTVNSEFVMEARDNPIFRQTLEKAELKIADGWGIKWAAQILSLGKVERISGIELVEEILKRADEEEEKIFLLGASPGVAEQAARQMKKQYPRISYDWFEGARTVKLEQKEEASMTIAKINGFEPDYLLVAYGSPWQDIWIEENREYLRVRVAIGVGGTLDEWAGVVRACPSWIDKMGAKWLWRWLSQPKLRTSRILKVFKFAYLVWRQKLID